MVSATVGKNNGAQASSAMGRTERANPFSKRDVKAEPDEMFMKRLTKKNLPEMIRKSTNLPDDKGYSPGSKTWTTQRKMFGAALGEVGEKETFEIFAKEVGLAETFSISAHSFPTGHSIHSIGDGYSVGDSVRAMFYYLGTENALKAAVEYDKGKLMGVFFEFAVAYEELKGLVAAIGSEKMEEIKSSRGSIPLCESHRVWRELMSQMGTDGPLSGVFSGPTETELSNMRAVRDVAIKLFGIETAAKMIYNGSVKPVEILDGVVGTDEAKRLLTEIAKTTKSYAERCW